MLNNAFNEDEDELVKSEGSDIYSKQLDMYSTSDSCFLFGGFSKNKKEKNQKNNSNKLNDFMI